MRSSIVAILLCCQFINVAAAAVGHRDAIRPERGEPVDAVSKFRSPDALIFDAELTKLAPESDISNALEAQSEYFLDRFREATKEQFGKAVEKSRLLNKKRIGEASAKPPAKRSPRIYGKSQLPADFLEPGMIPAAEYPTRPADPADGIDVVEVETDTSFRSTATEQKVTDLPEATVTRVQAVDSEVGFDGKNTMSKRMSTDETVESASKSDAKKVTKTSKNSFAAAFEICPDFEGVVRGTGTVKFYSQTTINTGRQLAALTTDFTVDFRVTAYVNDDAEMTHFDLKGTAIEKTLGFDRARRLDLITSTNGVTDGTRSTFIQFENNTPPRSVESEFGGKRSVSAELGNGTSKPLPTNTSADNLRLDQASRLASEAFVIDLDLLMRSSISRWQNYECVTVKCTAPKTSLMPNESVDVAAVSVSNLDQSKFNAKLNGTGTRSVTPEVQDAKPSAIYSLTAPDKEKATLIVKSVSRRGIGLEVLEIPVEESKKKPPVKKGPPPPKATVPIWTGTVKAVRTYKNFERGKADGRLLRQLRNVESTYNIEILLTGDRDLSGGIVNNFIGNARAGYVKEETRERLYASGRMSCNSSIIESPETQKNILTYRGDSSGRVNVAVAINGSIAHIDFSPLPLQAAFTHAYIYETACPSYNNVNTKTVRSEHLIDVTESGFEVDFSIDPSAANVLTGSKTVTESDGSETTYTWNLSRV